MRHPGSRPDLAIRGGLIVDGLGTAPYTGTIGITGKRLSAVSPGSVDIGARAAIDVDGLVVSPGFIDLHTHCDFTLPVQRAALGAVSQGVTTQVLGNCGFSAFPGTADRLKLLREHTGVFDAGIDWRPWGSTEDYARYVMDGGVGTNIALLVGHGALRIATMGLSADPPTLQQMSSMKSHLGEALKQGAIGLSSGLVYAPSSFADDDELIGLAEVVRDHGGFWSVHMRNEADLLLESVNEVLNIAEKSGVSLQVSHHKVMGTENWGLLELSLARLSDARFSGLDVMIDQYPYTTSSTRLSIVLPQALVAGGDEALRKRLSDPEVVDALRREMTAASGSSTEKVGARRTDPDRVRILHVHSHDLLPYAGMTLREVSERRREDWFDCLLHILRADGTRTLALFDYMSEDGVERVMQQPHSAVASDGWHLAATPEGYGHPRSFGSFARVLGRYVRDRKTITLEHAVSKMTALPAQRLRRRDIGRLQTGALADLAIFDAGRVSDQSTWDNPFEIAIGFEKVLIGGQVVFDKGSHTGRLPGRWLRSTQGVGHG